jgi:hypothetical protein
MQAPTWPAREARVCLVGAIQPREAECRQHTCDVVGQSSFSLYSLFFQRAFSYANTRAVLDITMSFGFSVGDFIAVIELAKRIRKEFINAPDQFKDISDEYGILLSH